MGGDKLTRQELSWLLAQEARGAAKSLRAEVGELRASIRPPKPDDEDRISSLPMEKSLRALDDAIGLLNKLEANDPNSKQRGRRGRIDLATLLLEVAPDCRVEMEPGSGTDVVGDEQELRRMLLLLLNTQSGATGETVSARDVQLRRQGSWIRISVDLGPDAGIASEVERRWLSRMAVKHGGKLELQGRKQSVLLPAENSAQEEVEGLRKELFEAQQLGETYAREIASMFGASSTSAPEPPAHLSNTASLAHPASAAPNSALSNSKPPNSARSYFLSPTRLDSLRTLCAALHPVLLLAAGSAASPALTELLRDLRVLSLLQVTLAPPVLELSLLLRETVQALKPKAQLRGVSLELGDLEPSPVRADAELLTLLLRYVVLHAVEATPAGHSVQIVLNALGRECRLSIQDAGAVIPASAVQDLLLHRIDATEAGRAPSLPLFVCQAILEALNGRLEFSSADGSNLTQVFLVVEA